MRRRRCWLLAALGGVLLILPASSSAATLSPIGSFDQPIYVTSEPANPNRLFVVERAGVIKLVQGGSVTTFADLTSVVRCCDVERGLFSIALAPDFEQSGLLYVDYTGHDGPGNLHVAELHASGNSAGIGTLRNVLTINHSQAANHNGGQLQFGPDGYLYISTGDGGSTPANAQNVNSLLGKVLRINPRQNGPSPYSVPQSNPFVGLAGADEIWAYGLRNPWRFSFDRATGNLLLADVGQATYEEIDYAPFSAGLGRGANYGWAVCEGFHPTGGAGTCPLAGRTDPIFEYPTHVAGTCAITGGYVARDPSLGDLFGRYLYADLCVGQVRSLVPGLPLASGDRAEGLSVSLPVSFGEDSCGRLYVVPQAATVFRLTGSGSLACSVLRVSRSGPGRGSVSGPGISCPGDCVEVFPLARSVVLRASPGRRSTFRRWHGACSGRRRCQLQMNADRAVVARFGGRLRTRLRLRVAHPRVPRHAHALLRVKVRPCEGRRRDRVRLLRGHRRIRQQSAARRLNRNCVARFRPRIERRWRFRAKIAADNRHRAGKSHPVVVFPRRSARG